MHLAACNTLPLPNDPSLNSPILTASLPFDIHAALDCETQSVPIPIDPSAFSNPGAIALASHGQAWHAKAKRVEECGELARIRSHSSGSCKHTRLEIGYCDCRFSPCCRQRKADEITKRWSPAIEHIMNHHRGARHVLLELEIPTDGRSREGAANAINYVCQRVAEWMKNISEQNLADNRAGRQPHICFHGEQDPYWVSCVGYIGDNLIIRVLIADSDALGASRITTDAWKHTIWPSWKVSVTVGNHLAFRSAFNHLVKPLPLKEDADWTGQEILFQRMQLFRAHNASLTCPGGELANVIPTIEIAEAQAAQELCVELTTDNSSTVPISKHPQGKSGVPCPHCGGVLDLLSGSMRVGSTQLRDEIARISGRAQLIQPPG